MAEFPVFQSQGPNIDVRLFGEAAQAGAKLGQEIPNPITSVIQGGVQGYQTGQQIALNNDKIKEADAEVVLKQAAAENTQVNQQLQIENTTAHLKNDTAQQSEQLDNLNEQQALEKQLQGLSPQQIADLYTSGKIDKQLADNVNLNKRVVATAYPFLTPEQRQGAQISLGKSSVDNFYAHQAERQQELFNTVKEDALNGTGGDLTSAIVSKLNVPAEAAPDAVRFVKATDYEVDQATGKLARGPDGSFLETTPEKKLELKGTTKGYIAVSTLPGSEGLVVADDLDTKQEAIYNRYKTQRALQNGQQAQYAKDLLYPPQRAGNTSSDSSGIPQFHERAQAQPAPQRAAPIDPFHAAVQKSLNLPDSVVKAADVPLTNFKTQAIAYGQKANRADPVTQYNYTTSLHTAIRAISDAQFDANPALKTQITSSHVTAYNDAIDNLPNTIPGFYTLAPSVQDSYTSLLEAFKVQEEKDLYFKKQSIPIGIGLNNIAADAINLQQAQQNQAARITQSAQRTNSIAAKWSSGSGAQ